VGAPQEDLPVRGGSLGPFDRADELAVAVAAEVQVERAAPLRPRQRRGGGRLGEVLEVHDLDRPSGRKDDAADVLAVGVGVAHALGREWLAALLIGALRRSLTSTSVQPSGARLPMGPQRPTTNGVSRCQTSDYQSC